MRIPESFISMKYCRVLAIKIAIPWVMGLKQDHAFYVKVHQVKLKHESNHLAKIGAKDGSGYIIAWSTAKHI